MLVVRGQGTGSNTSGVEEYLGNEEKKKLLHTLRMHNYI